MPLSFYWLPRSTRSFSELDKTSEYTILIPVIQAIVDRGSLSIFKTNSVVSTPAPSLKTLTNWRKKLIARLVPAKVSTADLLLKRKLI